MPKKGKKGGKKGKKKGGKKKAKGPANAEDIMQRLLKCYERNCHNTDSRMCPRIAAALRGCMENNAILAQFILESVEMEKEGALPVLIEPFLAALRQERYTFIRDLYIWKYPMSYENTATLALLLEKPFYPIRMLEVMDCLLDSHRVERLSRSFKVAEVLTKISLDYNEFGDEGCESLCKGLEKNITMLSVSLCYCDLGVKSGTILGKMISTTAVRDLYIDGNNLECEGAMELIKLCVEQSEMEALLRAEAAKKKLEEEEATKTAVSIDDNYDEYAKENKLRYTPESGGEQSGKASDILEAAPEKKKKKKGKKKKKKEPPPPPRIGPWIHKLHIADNAIDNLAYGAKFAPVICMRLFKKLLMHSDCIEELDLEDNWIGDLAGREVLEALEHRKEEKMGGVKVRTTHKLSTDVFNSIVKLGSGLKKKKKKGKKKKKK
ncbi:uncharacterized protein LOC123554471 isoform X1 [Mercenaria mercenaria]|uniref:uncharacterized protein LOC123554471 isoform X1 n=1 Tax=Mercenaria mercenaria TaxID=6596 RepID=UPI00234F30D0|nr:uncharacterized protein LOC123554471 isoform X1 [Mercenaria mercenaria]XP_053404040.1 uncharacterized protein LOC123554471 isoform X1 [Mercenaria mercenaria]